MTKRMLIDATHEDEQRVVVLDNEALNQADFHSAAKAQIKGNIYLARVTRVEPSLQAAFVDFGNGKHGFLPFSEIHPDYFQIPLADRDALLEDVQNALNSRSDQISEKAETQEENETPAVEQLSSLGEDSDENIEKAEDNNDAVADIKPKRVARQKKKASPKAVEVEDSSASTSDQNAEKPARVRRTKKKPSAEAADKPSDQNTDELELKKESQKRKTPKSKASSSAAPKKDEAEDIANEKPAKSPRKKTIAAAIEEEVVYEKTHESDPESQDSAGADHADELTDTDHKPRSRSRSRRRNNRPNSQDNKRQSYRSRRRDDDTDYLNEADFEARSMTRAILSKKYKIQEVIKRNQVILVQAAKEERGDKGAALTTYLSLPGRYCVLMPNTHRGGGVSRRIADGADRKRLKSVLDDLDLAPSMSLIVRTAGAERTKQEIKRDFAYLSRTWDEIRATTLNSFAPELVYEEANIIKRAIRDIYEGDTDEVLVSGEDAYKSAKAFMKTLTPSHAARVKHYKHDLPLFQAYGVEGMLESLNRPQVRLPSGGYLVMNQTEALVAVDVNSGKATKERNIEETALRTNLEAARETARQLRLRDMAGLVVIDFIDMEDNKNVIAVERALKEALKSDRARIQVGRISQFGLLELSRQRLRPSVAEATMSMCPTCHGTGYVKSNSTNARSIVRQIEQSLAKEIADEVTIFAGHELALTLANDQRANIARLEATYKVVIEIAIDAQIGPSHFRCSINRMGKLETFGSDPMAEVTSSTRSNRHRNKRNIKDKQEINQNDEQLESKQSGPEIDREQDEDSDRKRRRRGKRGGRRRVRKEETGSIDTDSINAEPQVELAKSEQADIAELATNTQEKSSLEPSGSKPKSQRRRQNNKKPIDNESLDAASETKLSKAPGEEGAPDTPSAHAEDYEPHPVSSKPEDTPPSTGPKRSGWWSRVGGS